MNYIALYKPFGVLSSFTHETQSASDGGKRTLSEFGLPAGVYAAGRLDYDSEGLLVLSDDGAFIHRLTDPAHKLPKIYVAQVEGVPGEPALARLRAGLAIKDYRTRPCGARVIDEPALGERGKPVTPKGPTAWLEIIMTEGRKRQVRHMTAAVGLPTVRLARIAVGPVTLRHLAPGQWRTLEKMELESIIGRVRASPADRGIPGRPRVVYTRK